jgi:hypothetical protein
MLTNLETKEDIAEAIESGSTEYLVKVNYSLKDLEEKLKKF